MPLRPAPIQAKHKHTARTNRYHRRAPCPTAVSPDGVAVLRRKTQTACVLIVAQSICVGIGVWVQHLRLASSLGTVLRTAELDGLERHLLESTPQAAGTGAGDQRMGHPSISDRRVMLVNRDWTPVRKPEDDTGVPGAMEWAPQPTATAESDRPVRGTLRIGGTPYLAVTRPLDHDRILVAFSPVADINELASTLRQSGAAISAVTAAWMIPILAVLSWLMLGHAYDRFAASKLDTDARLVGQTRKLVRTRDAVIFGLAKLADSRDADTGAHLERISAFSTALAKKLSTDQRYADQVTPAFVRLIGISAALHDIGKVGVPDHILLKQGRLTDDERTRMQRHTLVGAECLRQIEHRLGSSNFLETARQIALAHHERWDGCGYPRGLRGEAIPLCARIVAIADVYDALSTARSYKPAYSHEKCLEIMRSESGYYFDPDVFQVFAAIESEFERIAARYRPVEPAEPPAPTKAACRTTEDLQPDRELTEMLPEFPTRA